MEDIVFPVLTVLDTVIYLGAFMAKNRVQLLHYKLEWIFEYNYLFVCSKLSELVAKDRIVGVRDPN